MPSDFLKKLICLTKYFRVLNIQLSSVPEILEWICHSDLKLLDFKGFTLKHWLWVKALLFWLIERHRKKHRGNLQLSMLLMLETGDFFNIPFYHKLSISWKNQYNRWVLKYAQKMNKSVLYVQWTYIVLGRVALS